RSFIFGAGFLSAPLVFHAASIAQAVTPESAAPVARTEIDLASLGYPGLSPSARLSGGANITLDFIDANHVLLTFNPKKLFHRLPECPPTHDDRLIHAMVLEVPGGTVVREADWYMHDARRYLWPLGSGRFLLRRLNRLYAVDANMQEKLVLDSPKELIWVTVTPDGKHIVTETREEETPRKNETKNEGKSRERVKISIVDSNSWAVQTVIQARGAVNLEATSSGVAEVSRVGAGVWLVRFGPDHTNIASSGT